MLPERSGGTSPERSGRSRSRALERCVRSCPRLRLWFRSYGNGLPQLWLWLRLLRRRSCPPLLRQMPSHNCGCGSVVMATARQECSPQNVPPQRLRDVLDADGLDFSIRGVRSCSRLRLWPRCCGDGFPRLRLRLQLLRQRSCPPLLRLRPSHIMVCGSVVMVTVLCTVVAATTLRTACW